MIAPKMLTFQIGQYLIVRYGQTRFRQLPLWGKYHVAARHRTFEWLLKEMLGYCVAGARVPGTPEGIGDIIVGQLSRVVLCAIAGRAETVCVSERLS